MTSLSELIIKSISSAFSRISSSFYTYHKRPKQFVYKNTADTNFANDLSVIIQGPIIDCGFVCETIKLYQNIVFPGAQIIVSTWADTRPDYLKVLSGLNITLVVSEKPKHSGPQNINYQICSTRKALDSINPSSVYVIKSRTDQRVYEKSTYSYFLDLFEVFDVDNDRCYSKIVVLDLNTFKNRLYGVSDMFLFGKVKDITRYWQVEYDQRPYDIVALSKVISQHDLSVLCVCEVYLCVSYLKKVGHNVKWSTEDSDLALKRYFIVASSSEIDLFWKKYSNKEFMWRNYRLEDSDMMLLSHRDWLRLYVGNK